MQYYMQTTFKSVFPVPVEDPEIAELIHADVAVSGIHEDLAHYAGHVCVRISGRQFERITKWFQQEAIGYKVRPLVPPDGEGEPVTILAAL